MATGPESRTNHPHPSPLRQRARGCRCWGASAAPYPIRVDASALGDVYRQRLTTQDYSPSTRIDGVDIIQLRQMMDEGGDFMELLRLNDRGELLAKPDMQVRQVNYSRVLPGAIKAFHLHFHQEDVWFVPPTDRLLIGLLDVRKDSPTYQQAM